MVKNIRNGGKPLQEILHDHLAIDDDEVVTIPNNSEQFTLNNPINVELTGNYMIQNDNQPVSPNFEGIPEY